MFFLPSQRAEPCFTKNFAYFSNRQIKQMTLVFFRTILFLHTVCIMAPLRGRNKMPALERLTDWYILMQIASKSMVLIGRLNTKWKMN